MKHLTTIYPYGTYIAHHPHLMVTMNHSQSIHVFFTIQPYSTQLHGSNGSTDPRIACKLMQLMPGHVWWELFWGGKFNASRSFRFGCLHVLWGPDRWQAKQWGIDDLMDVFYCELLVNVSYEDLKISVVSFLEIIHYAIYQSEIQGLLWALMNHPLLQERVLYRLLSGWHASTSISIAKNYYAPGTLKGSWHCKMMGQQQDFEKYCCHTRLLSDSAIIWRLVCLLATVQLTNPKADVMTLV